MRLNADELYNTEVVELIYIADEDRFAEMPVARDVYMIPCGIDVECGYRS